MLDWIGQKYRIACAGPMPGLQRRPGYQLSSDTTQYREVIARQVGGLWDGARRHRDRGDRPSVPVR